MEEIETFGGDNFDEVASKAYYRTLETKKSTQFRFNGVQVIMFYDVNH